MARKSKATLSSDAREIIANVIKICDEEKRNNAFKLPISSMTQRAAMYAGVSLSTIKRIRIEDEKRCKENPGSALRAPGKTRKRLTIMEKVDENDFSIIKKMMEEMKCVPSCKKLLIKIREKINFPWTDRTLYRLLKSRGLMEPQDILNRRYRYLKAKRPTRLPLTATSTSSESPGKMVKQRKRKGIIHNYKNEVIEKQKLSDFDDPLSEKLKPKIDIHYNDAVFIKTEPIDHNIILPTTNIPVIKNDEIKAEPYEVTSLNPNDIIAVEIEGNRVVDINHFMKQAKTVLNHSEDVKCRKGLVITEESKNGLMSTIFFQCRNCWKIYCINTHPNDTINEHFVKGIKSANVRYEESTKMLASLKVAAFSEEDPLSVKLKPDIDIHYNLSFIKNENTDEDVSLAITNIPLNDNDEIKASIPNNVSSTKIVGNRVVAIQYFLNEITTVLNHSVDVKCRKALFITEERRNELISTICFLCKNCWKLFAINTHPNDKINAEFVKGIKSCDGGHRETTIFLLHLKIPRFSEDAFKSLE